MLFGVAGDGLDIVTRINSIVPGIGASGAISGVMGAYLVLFPNSKITTLVINQTIKIPAFFYLGVWILWQIIFGMLYSTANFFHPVGWFAHIWRFYDRSNSGCIVQVTPEKTDRT